MSEEQAAASGSLQVQLAPEDLAFLQRSNGSVQQAQARVEQAQKMLLMAQGGQQACLVFLQEKYRTGPQDSIDLKSGVIHRPEQKPAADNAARIRELGLEPRLLTPEETARVNADLNITKSNGDSSKAAETLNKRMVDVAT